MRRIVLALVVPLATAGCDGKPVTGPEAQRVVAQAKEARASLVTGALVLVDGVRLASDKSLQDLDPTTVETVEVLKGAAASRLYGPEGARGVILITTKRAAATPAPSR
jgi:TonB-dependent SusC/RagA subfamily outer membrane receptor